MPADSADDSSDAGSESSPRGPSPRRPLSPEVSEQMEVVYGVIGPYLDMTLEEMEIDLMGSDEPEEEAMAWIAVTAAWDAYHQQYLDEEVLYDEEEKKITAALIAISDGESDPAALPVEPDVGRKLIACFREIAGE
jgi:hypothetical protein